MDNLQKELQEKFNLILEDYDTYKKIYGEPIINGVVLKTITLDEKYSKKWNIDSRNYFGNLYKDGVKLSDTLYSISGIGTMLNSSNNMYFILLKHTEAYYDDDIIKDKNKKRHLASSHSIIDIEGNVKIELEDYSSILFRLENNVPGSFTTCQVCAGRKSDTEFQIYGDKCSFAWDHREATRLWIGHRDKANEILIESPSLLGPESAQYAAVPGGHPLGYFDAEFNLFNDFYNAVKNGETEEMKRWRPTFETGAEEMNILESIVKSNKLRRWVGVS